jgi:DNA-binding LacI/PurR family transcriptional regulator
LDRFRSRNPQDPIRVNKPFGSIQVSRYNGAMQREPRIRLADVARAAGVSLGTASNVFAHPERVRAEVRERVETAARELGYHGPDPKGLLLRAGRFNALGVVPPADLGVADALHNPVFRNFLRGVAEVCDAASANLVIISDREHGRGVSNALVDGVVLSRIEQLSEIEPARLRRIPFAVVDFDPGPEVSSVRSDARAGALAAARHLIELGHRRFAILSFLRAFGPAIHHPPGGARPPEAAGMLVDQEKYAAYAEAFAAAGIDIAEVPMVQGQPWSRDAASMLLDVAPEATAVLSMSVMQAMVLLEEARRRGLVVPRDLSVVGFNDLPEAAAGDPPLTTVDGMNIEKGRVAARMVLDAGPPRHVVLPARLLVRGSTAPPPR